MTLTDYTCQEKKEEEDLPALKIALTHGNNDSKTIQKKRGERLITVTRNNTDDTKTKRYNTDDTKIGINRKKNWK